MPINVVLGVILVACGLGAGTLAARLGVTDQSSRLLITLLTSCVIAGAIGYFSRWGAPGAAIANLLYWMSDLSADPGPASPGGANIGLGIYVMCSIGGVLICEAIGATIAWLGEERKFGEAPPDRPS